MFNLETEILRWRETMQAAGIGPGEMRDELESHVRDKFADLVRAGRSEVEAFQMAAAAVGEGDALLREFSRLGRRPWSLSMIAWAALGLNAAGLIYFPYGDGYLVTGYLAAMRSMSGSGESGSIFGLLSMFHPLLFNFLLPAGGLVTSLTYMNWPGQRQRRALVIYSCLILWLFGCRVLTFVPFQTSPYPPSRLVFFPAAPVNELPFSPTAPPLWSVLLVTILVASLGWVWLRNLRFIPERRSHLARANLD